jgi:hypothetical protein
MASTGGKTMLGFTRSGLASHLNTGYARVLFVGDQTTDPDFGDLSTNGQAHGLAKMIWSRFRPTEVVGHCFWHSSGNVGSDGNLMITGSPPSSTATIRRGNGSDITGPYTANETFSKGGRSFAPGSLSDRWINGSAFTSTNMGGPALDESYPATMDKSWFDRVDVNVSFGLWREADGSPNVDIRAARKNDALTATYGTVLLDGANLTQNQGQVLVTLNKTIPGEIGTSDKKWPYLNMITIGAQAQKSVIMTACRMWKAGAITSGIETSFFGGPGYPPESFLDETDPARELMGVTNPITDGYAHCNDTHLAPFLSVYGWPTVLWIRLGHNSPNAARSKAAALKETYQRIVERFAAAYRANGKDIPWFVLETPYACPALSIDQHDAYLSVVVNLHNNGTPGHDAPPGSPYSTYPPVPSSKIAIINRRQILVDDGARPGVWDANGVFIANGSGGTGLVNTTQNSLSGAVAQEDLLISLLENPVVDTKPFTGVADITDSPEAKHRLNVTGKR